MENEKCFNTPEEIYKKLGKIWTTMREGIERGCRTEGVLSGPLRVPRRAAPLYRQLTTNENLEDYWCEDPVPTEAAEELGFAL